MRIYLIKEFSDKNWRQVLPVNNWYEGKLKPADPNALHIWPPAYIVKCNDGKFRVVSAEYFITQEQWRERQLIELGIWK
jgi:hypothetical protein